MSSDLWSLLKRPLRTTTSSVTGTARNRQFPPLVRFPPFRLPVKEDPRQNQTAFCGVPGVGNTQCLSVGTLPPNGTFCCAYTALSVRDIVSLVRPFDMSAGADGSARGTLGRHRHASFCWQTEVPLSATRTTDFLFRFGGWSVLFIRFHGAGTVVTVRDSVRQLPPFDI